MRFLVYAKFKTALFRGTAGLPERDDTSLDNTNPEQVLQKIAKYKNDSAMTNLTMAFTSEKTMGFIYKSMTVEWPGGTAFKVVEALMKKYKPQDTITRLELHQKLNKVSMKKGQDPSAIFEQLSSIKNQYNAPGKQIEEGDLIAVVLDAATAEYQPVLTSEQRLRGEHLTLEHLESAMNQHWRQVNHSKTTDEEDRDENETSLSAFEGTCFVCKQKGHKANTCPKKNSTNHGNTSSNNSNGGRGYQRFSGKCSNCGKTGHISANCWQKEENKDV